MMTGYLLHRIVKLQLNFTIRMNLINMVNLAYALYIGFIYYDGGKYWAAILGHPSQAGTKWGLFSLKCFFLELLVLFSLALLVGDTEKEPSWTEPGLLFFCFMVLHLTICVVAIVLEFLGFGRSTKE
jgi:hypothetical protein